MASETITRNDLMAILNEVLPPPTPIVRYKEVSVSTGTLGQSTFNTTPKATKTVDVLFGVPQAKLVSLSYRQGNTYPSANLSFSIWNSNLYIASTVSTTVSGSIIFKVAYID